MELIRATEVKSFSNSGVTSRQLARSVLDRASVTTQ